MEILTKPRTTEQTTPNTKSIFPSWWWIVILIIVAMASKFGDFVERKPDGSYEIKPKRKQELERRKKQIDEAEQYVLRATINGWYECYNCENSDKIFLYIGEVWRYGVSKNGIKRYKQWWYKAKKVKYFTEFTGTYSECLKRELEQIYAYPILPENLKRKEKLPRPAGNKEDY